MTFLSDRIADADATPAGIARRRLDAIRELHTRLPVDDPLRHVLMAAEKIAWSQWIATVDREQIREMKDRRRELRGPARKTWCPDHRRYERGECNWPHCQCPDAAVGEGRAE